MKFLSILAGVVVGCVCPLLEAREGAAASFRAAMDDPSRLTEHRDRDHSRKPAQVLEFAFPNGVRNNVIADLVPAGGYYTALLSRAVGENGHVVAIDPVRIFEYVPTAKTAYSDYAEKEPRSNVTYSAQMLDEMQIDTQLDGAIMVLYYHDTYWTGVDRAEMNRRIFAALKPGANFLIVDHHAPAGSGEAVTQSIHRMDASLVAPELLAAGFEFVRSSDLLENDEDPMTEHVFKEGVRGHTSRFIYLFRKPI